jgi:hypothetical protein
MMPIAMNLSSERKQSMKSILTTISLALALVSPAFAGIDWGFPNDSGTYSAVGGPGTATVHLGGFATGYHDGITIPWTMGSSGPGASGLWDLGSAGSIILSGFSMSGPVTLQVFQWVGNGIGNGTYSGDLTFTVNNGTPGSFTQVGSAIGGTPGVPGAWWQFTAGLGVLNPGDTVTVTAGSGGAIIDRLTLVPEPATMIAGAILLIPFALSTWPILRRRRTS